MNSFMWPLLVINRTITAPCPLGFGYLLRSRAIMSCFSASSVVVMPMIILFLFQKTDIGGVARGGIKANCFKYTRFVV